MLGIRRLRLPQPPTRKLVIELVWDNWPGRLMYRHGWAGVTTWLPFIVLISYWSNPDPETRYHEAVHVAQGDRDCCFLVTWARYAWGWLRHGYDEHPMELEAYGATAEAVAAGLPPWATAAEGD